MDDYISLTDIARYKDSSSTDDIIKNWLRNRNTIELLGFWEQMYNPDFKPVEFDGFRKQAGLNSFVLTPKRWIESTNAIGLISKAGRYGGRKTSLLNLLPGYLLSSNSMLLRNSNASKKKKITVRNWTGTSNAPSPK